jgi:hypothetical protein
LKKPKAHPEGLSAWRGPGGPLTAMPLKVFGEDCSRVILPRDKRLYFEFSTIHVLH